MGAKKFELKVEASWLGILCQVSQPAITNTINHLTHGMNSQKKTN